LFTKFTDSQDLNKWIAATFSGRTIAINDQHVTPVTAEDVSKYDAWDVSLVKGLVVQRWAS